MRLVFVSAALLAAAALAGCQRPPAPGAEAAKAGPTPSATAAASHAPSHAGASATAAAPASVRRPGLWEQRVSDGQGVQVTRLCLDPATDQRLSVFGRQLNENQCQNH